MYADILPPVSLKIAYKHRETGNIRVVDDTYTHIKDFSPTEYEKIYEIATIKVN